MPDLKIVTPQPTLSLTQSEMIFLRDAIAHYEAWAKRHDLHHLYSRSLYVRSMVDATLELIPQGDHSQD